MSIPPASGHRDPGPAVWFVPSLGSVIALLALAHALFTRAGHLFSADGDVGRHIRVGTVILDTLAIPRVDLFSHTMRGQPFVPYEWLSEVAFAAANRTFGLGGVATLAAVLFTATCMLVYWSAVRLRAGRLAAFLVAAASLVLQTIHLLPRPHLFTTLFAAAFFAVLVDHSVSRRPLRLFWLPPLMVLWVNLHGGFLVGFIALAVFLADAWISTRHDEAARRRQLRPLAVVTALCLGATLVNPVGPALWAHTTGYLRIEFLVDLTQEYQSPDFHAVYGKVFLLVLLAGAGVAMSGRARPGFLGATMFLGWLAASLHSARNIPIFAVMALPFLAPWLTRAVEATAEGPAGRIQRLARRFRERSAGIDAIDRSVRPLLPAGVAIALVIFALGPGRNRYRFSEEAFPVRAVAEAGLPPVEGNVFNHLTWGGYLLYAAYPRIPVFIDGQTDFYGESLSRDYLVILQLGPGWEELLDRHRIDWTLTRPASPLTQGLALHPDWRLHYADSTATVYVRGDRSPASPGRER